MPIITSGNWATPSAVSPLVPSYPIPGHPSALVLSQDYVVELANFNPTALDTPHPSYPTAYLVEETDPVDIGAGVVRFTRSWATIPPPHEEGELFSYTVPGITSADPLGLVEYIFAAADIDDTTEIELTSPPHHFEVGDFVLIQYLATDPTTLLTFTRTAAREVLAITSATITVSKVVDALVITLWQSVRDNLEGRDPFQLVVPSWVRFDYFLPGVTSGIAKPSDIEALAPVPIIDTSTGNRVDSYSTVTAPTLAEYRASVTARAEIIAEASAIRRWRGNIWQRSTRYITAI